MSNIVNKDSVKISNDIVAVIAAIACTEVEGVYGILGSNIKDIIANPKKSSQKGIKIGINEKNEINLDIMLIVKDQYIIPNVCKKVQEIIREKIEIMVGLSVKTINIDVIDVQ